MPRITEMFAFVISDTEPDDEGVIGFATPEGWLPLVGADVARAATYRQLAQQVADRVGKPVRLLRFAGPPIVVETLDPAGGR